jgi:hypothetical protein
LQEKNLTLFDLLLNETHPWETLHDEHKILATDILARLLANTAPRNQDEEKDHD